jgi:hypothetical protein
MYVECTSNRACRGESLGPGMSQPVRAQLRRSDRPLDGHPNADPNLAVGSPGSRRPAVRNHGLVSRERILLSPRRRHGPTGRRFFVPEWEPSAPGDAGGCCVCLTVEVSRGGSLTPRAAVAQSQRAEPANLLHSRLADHFAYPTFCYRLPIIIIVNPYRNAGSTSVANSVFQI